MLESTDRKLIIVSTGSIGIYVTDVGKHGQDIDHRKYRISYFM